jgi:hypothetical protein
VAEALQLRETAFVAIPWAVRLVGIAGGVVGGVALTEKFQFGPPLLSQVPDPLLKATAMVVALTGTVYVNFQTAPSLVMGTPGTAVQFPPLYP